MSMYIPNEKYISHKSQLAPFTLGLTENHDEEKESNELSRLIAFLEGLEAQNQLESAQKKRYINWGIRYLNFNRTKALTGLGDKELTAFLEYLAFSMESGVAVQKSAEKSLRFIYKNFLNVEFGNLHVTRRSPRRGFFSNYQKDKVYHLIKSLPKSTQLIAKVALEVSLQLEEVLYLRVADLDLKNNQLSIRNQDGSVRFKANIPLSLILELKIQSMKVHQLVQDEKERSIAESESEMAVLANHLETPWQYLFPQGNRIESLSGAEKLNQFPILLLKDDISQTWKLVQKRKVVAKQTQVKSIYPKFKASRNNNVAYVKNRIDQLKAIVNQESNTPVIQQKMTLPTRKVVVA